MRLIDADKIDFSKVFGGSSDFGKDLISAAQKLIDMQPAAFDKEKVINALMIKATISEEGIELCAEKGLTQSKILASGRALAYRLAIEIVEKGGIE